jgi:putative FmdB family regulatory protein
MRNKVENSGHVAKLFDFKCPKCDKVFEDMATRTQLENSEIKCVKCKIPAEKLFSTPLINKNAAASWRR